MAHRILLIITGSVAAYKALEIIRALRRESMDVTGILTTGGAEFITPLAVSGVSGNPTYSDLFSLKDETEMGHIRLSREHDLIVVAPASADFIAKMAQGRADDIASATLLAADKPVLIAPAMNHRMWEHKATQRNLSQITADGVEVIAPERGEMACGEEGIGRLAEVETIVARIQNKLRMSNATQDRPLLGRRALVTSGPTQEAIDPVRYIGNRSSGKQGYAIAETLARAGAEVTLISGPVALPVPTGVKLVRVTTAKEMHKEALHALPVDIAVCAAAVADWTIGNPAKEKLKKSASAPKLKFAPTADILAEIATHPSHRPALVIGFAAETNATLTDTKAKRARKGCDWLLANDVSDGKVFGADETQLTCIEEKGIESWPAMSKREAAERLVEKIVRHIKEVAPARTPALSPQKKSLRLKLKEMSNDSVRARYLASQGMKQADIARQLGVYTSHVSDALKVTKRRKATTDMEIGLAQLGTTTEKILFMYKSGIIPSRIAKRLDVPVETVKPIVSQIRKQKTAARRAQRKTSSAVKATTSPPQKGAAISLENLPTTSARARYLASQGMPKAEIAKRLGVNYSHVVNALKPSRRKHNITRLEIKLAQLESAKDKVRFLHKQGMTPARIARKLEMNAEAVKALLPTRRKKTAAKETQKKTSAKKTPSPAKPSLHPRIAPQAIEQIRNDPSFPNQAARIRYMAALGMSRAEIARALDVRYQTVRNTLVSKERSAGRKTLPKTG